MFTAINQFFSVFHVDTLTVISAKIVIFCCNYRRIVIEKKLKNDGKITNLPYESYDYSKVRFYLLSLII